MTNKMGSMGHVLSQLVLPDRYERLEEFLGSSVANLLVPPSPKNVEALKALANDVMTRDEGVLIPLVGQTGTGKTTFVMNASQWASALYGPTCLYQGALTFEGLSEAVAGFSKNLPANGQKIVPINIDHREGAPPSETELAALKRFLRTKAGNVRSIVFWPETNKAVAEEISKRYVEIAGETAIELPLECEGPSRDTWRATAKDTLSLANRVSNLEELGVNPDNYDPYAFRTLGTFLRRISQDFNRQLLELRAQLEKPVSVIITFASESSDPGILSQLTSSSRYGLLDGHALVSVTPQSALGRWWSARRGLLTRTIVQLDAHAVCLPPTPAASCVRNFSESMAVFDTAGYRRYGPARGVRDFGSSDLGKLIRGENISRFESRGTTADEASAAFQLLAESGFNLGKDKSLNHIMREALKASLSDEGIQFDDVTSEKKLPFCALIPDNAIFFSNRVLCVEYTWRKGKFLESGNRSTVAQYILAKLQAYARQLGWTSD